MTDLTMQYLIVTFNGWILAEFSTAHELQEAFNDFVEIKKVMEQPVDVQAVQTTEQRVVVSDGWEYIPSLR